MSKNSTKASQKSDQKLTQADLNLIQSMAAVNPNSSLAMCNIPQRVENAIDKGEKISESDARIIAIVADRNPNSALAQTGVQERAMQSAEKYN